MDDHLYPDPLLTSIEDILRMLEEVKNAVNLLNENAASSEHATSLMLN